MPGVGSLNICILLLQSAALDIAQKSKRKSKEKEDSVKVPYEQKDSLESRFSGIGGLTNHAIDANRRTM